jgi:hypothetical protein
MTTTHHATQAERSIVFVLNTSADIAFPLFGPKREMDWDPNWQPQFLVPENGDQTAHGSVFLIRGEAQDSVWVMTVYDVDARLVQYVRVTPGHSVGQLWISVTPLQAAHSQVKVSYRLTGLSPTGSSFVDKWMNEFPHTGPDWAEVLNHYLQTGRPLLNKLYDVQE